MRKIIDRYKLIYPNGIIQEKDLISHDDFNNIIKPKRKLMYELENSKNKNYNEEANVIKKELRFMFGDNFFTTESPLHEAITLGYMDLLASQGYRNFIKVIKIN